jgi:signal transduction histidine kinase
MLHEFVTQHREEIISRCRDKVVRRSMPPPTDAEINHGVPAFLDQLVDVLRLGELSSPEIRRTALLHGHDLLEQGLTVSQVVHDYGDVCQAITDLAVELEAPIESDDFRTLNACLDDAIAVAVTQYARERDQSAVEGEAGRQQLAIDGQSERHQTALDAETARGSERLGYLAHELRNLLNTAILASDALVSGRVGAAGSTGAVLRRSLLSAADLISTSLAEVRVTKDLRTVAFSVAGFMDEIEPAAVLAAGAQHITLRVEPVEVDASVDADRQVLAAVLMNLLQNAFKFTRPESTVILRVVANAERVLFEVQDECGGLPLGNTEDLFRPFEQRSSNRTGLGLGLAFSRWAIETHQGRIYARNLPGVGCVFTINLPSAHVTEPALQ